MNDILRRQQQFDRPSQRHMQFVDFGASLGMLCLPHPLLGDYLDLQRVGRRTVGIEIKDRAPDEHDQGKTERDYRPENFQAQIAGDFRRALVVGTAPIAECENDDSDRDQQRKKHTHADEKKIQRVDARRHGGGLIGKERKAEVHDRAQSFRCICARRSRRSISTTKPPRANTVAAPARRSTSSYDQTVLSGERIVVVTKQQKLIDRRADFPRRGFDQTQTQIPRRKLNAVVIARDFALRASASTIPVACANSSRLAS